jgi:hypothetical protein
MLRKRVLSKRQKADNTSCYGNEYWVNSRKLITRHVTETSTEKSASWNCHYYGNGGRNRLSQYSTIKSNTHLGCLWGAATWARKWGVICTYGVYRELRLGQGNEGNIKWRKFDAQIAACYMTGETAPIQNYEMLTIQRIAGKHTPFYTALLTVTDVQASNITWNLTFPTCHPAVWQQNVTFVIHPINI